MASITVAAVAVPASAVPQHRGRRLQLAPHASGHSSEELKLRRRSFIAYWISAGSRCVR
jgi:hypothetical protein